MEVKPENIIEKAITKVIQMAEDKLTLEEVAALEEHLLKNKLTMSDLRPKSTQPEETPTKKPVGYEHPVPEGMRKELTIGGYTFASDKTGLYIIGRTKFNLTESEIYPCCIVPLTSQYIREMADANDKNSVYSYFIIEDRVLYMVSYNNLAYLFKDDIEAMDFLSVIFQYKNDAVTQGALLDRIQEEL